MAKKALIVSALSGFILSFLKHDIETLQSMGYELYCAASTGNYNFDDVVNIYKDMGVGFHHIDFSSKAPLSKKSLRAFREIRQLLKEEHFDLIHCHTPITGVIVRLAAGYYRRHRGTKVIYTSHGFYFHKASGKKAWIIYYTIEKMMSALCDAIITINTEDYEAAKKMLCKRVYHINGVGCDTACYRDAEADREAYREMLGVEPDQIMLLDIGELSVRKNHGIIIDAIAKLNMDKLVLVICGKAITGSGTYEILKKKAEEKKVKVIFAGHRHDIPQICKCADIGVLPSLREGLGLAGIEMMSAGLPLVTSNVHGIKDYMTDGKTGYMCDPYDADAFAKAIYKLCDPKQRDLFRENCIESAKRFDLAVSTGQMRQIYTELLA